MSVSSAGGSSRVDRYSSAAELETTNADGERPRQLLKPSLRAQLGLQTEEEEEQEDHTDWLGANFPIPNVPKLDSMRPWPLGQEHRLH